MTTNNFNQASNPDATTTARELANELSSAVAGLRESAQKLGEEIANIRTSREDIQEEYTATVRTFVKTTLSELSGEQFDTLAELVKTTPEAGGQGLAFQRDKMTQARDAALETINASSVEIIDADSFQDTVEAARRGQNQADTQLQLATAEYKDANSNLREWERTTEGALAALNETISAKGARAITQENRKYYDQTNIFSAAINYLTRDDSYRAVRKALVAYDQGEEGKDVFADMGAWSKKEKDLRAAATAAAESNNAAKAAYDAAAQNYSRLQTAGDAIKTDAQILAAIQDKVVSYLGTDAFMKAVADKYAEDFPSDIPLMSAKLTTLDKLEEGAQQKLASMQETINAMAAQSRQAGNLRPNVALPVDLDAVRRQNELRRAEFDNYTTATNAGWTRTRSYTPISTSTVYVDRSPSVLEIMLWNDLLNNHNHSDRGSASSTPYTADILGLDRSQADKYGVDAKAFDFAPEVSRQMQDFGMDRVDSGRSNIDEQITSAFDFVPAPSAAPSSNFDIYRPSATTNDGFGASPSFGSSTNS